MIAKELVKQIVESYFANNSHYLVDVSISNDNCINVEIDAFDGVSIDDCVALNRHIESQLDREVEDYQLEVSSAGLTSPFKVVKQYEKNIGNEVEVLTKDGRKITGILQSANADEFTLSIEKLEKQEGSKRKVLVTEEISFGYADIKYTKYIIRFK